VSFSSVWLLLAFIKFKPGAVWTLFCGVLHRLEQFGPPIILTKQETARMAIKSPGSIPTV
jgi:hypothetical protein